MLNDETITELRAKHGQVYHLETDDQDFVARAPNTAEWNRLTMQVLEGGPKQIYAFRDLALSCIVYPEKDALVRLLDEQPGLASALAKPLSEIAGATQEVRLKKL